MLTMKKPDNTLLTDSFNASDFSPEALSVIAELQQKLLAKETAYSEVLSSRATLESELKEAKDQLVNLWEKVKLLMEQRWKPSSEKGTDAQARLFDEAEQLAALDDETDDEDNLTEAESDTATTKPKKKRGHRAKLPADLPRKDVVIDLPDEEKTCTQDGTALTCIGEEVSERLCIIPAQYYVERTLRKKYACKTCEEGVKTAALPPQLLPKTNASPSLLAYLVVAKYMDSLPLYRLAQIFKKRMGVELPSSTQARWMIRVSEKIEPLMGLLRRHLLTKSELIHMDETTLQVNREVGREAHLKSYMWVQKGGPPDQPVVLFNYSTGRSAQVPKALLGDYSNILVTDGYAAYNAVVKDNQLIHSGCWAHARRKFKDAKVVQAKGKVGKADWIINQIQKLYAIETLAKNNQWDAATHLEHRKTTSQAILSTIREWLDKSLSHTLPKGKLGQALTYLNNQWDHLILFTKDVRIPLDNNAAENAIRPFAVGRKNWLFSDTPQGAQASANLYSLIETLKANKIEPYSYLCQLFEKLPLANTDEALEALLPWNLELPKEL